jgi:hypothetical protein
LSGNATNKTRSLRRDADEHERARLERDPDVIRFTRYAIAGIVGSCIPMLLVAWNFGLERVRTTLPNAVLSNLYDIQARAIMAGDLSVPKGSLGIEGFVIGGREYMYFGPLPALLRIPVLAITNRFDNRLTIPSLLIAWIVFVTFSALLLWRVRVIMRGETKLSRSEATAYAILMAAVGGGSVLVYLVALPLVYEEAQIWGAAMAIGALFAIVGVLERLTVGRLLAAGLLTTGAILSRPPDGWGCCLILGGAAVLILIRSRGRDLRWAGAVLAAGAVPLIIGIAINWAKFRTPFVVPYEDQVWTRLSLQRRQALAANGGRIFGPQFLPSTLVAYLRPDGIRFSSIFPFISLPARPAPSYGGAFLDLTYRTGSVPSFMPLLSLLGGWGLFAAFRRRVSKDIASLRLVVLGAAVIPVGVLFVGYIAHRYASDFLPVLVITSTIGIVDIAKRWAGWSRRRRVIGLGIMAALATFGILANLAVAMTASAQTSGGQTLNNLIGIEKRVSDWSGQPLNGYVERGSTLPDRSAPDRLRVIGDCHAVYVATGDRYETWVPVDVQGLSVYISVTAPGQRGTVRLVALAGHSGRYIELQHDGQGMYRFVVDGDNLKRVKVSTRWRNLPIGTLISLRVSPDSKYVNLAVYSPSMISAALPMTEWDLRSGPPKATPTLVRVESVPPSEQAALGVQVSPVWDRPSKLCQSL